MKDNKLFAAKEFTLKNGTTVTEPKSKAIFVVICLLIAVYFSAKITGFNLHTIN